jgi:beta-aspartyl-peptidase (threonine type)
MQTRIPRETGDGATPPRNGPLALAIHGGAWQIPDDEAEAHNDGMRAALEAGRRVLEAGGSAVDAVTAAIVPLEQDPTFDAGIGSILNTAGEVEMDASVMDGFAMRAGAVTCVKTVESPVRLARALLERGRHVFLAGDGAHEAARLLGLPMVDPAHFIVERERRRLEEILADARFRVPDPFDHPGAKDDPLFVPRLCHGGPAGAPTGVGDDRDEDAAIDRSIRPAPGGTVGAVARDREGRLAAATSTGGAPGKWPGRIGDSPVIGAGTYADDEWGACSATGWGEAILRAALASTAVRRLQSGREPQPDRGAHRDAGRKVDRDADAPGDLVHPALAARAAIGWFQRRVGGLGGIILLDRTGRIGWAFNTPRMSRAAWVEGAGEPVIAIDP